jgi:hypothetical protein
MYKRIVALLVAISMTIGGYENVFANFSVEDIPYAQSNPLSENNHKVGLTLEHINEEVKFENLLQSEKKIISQAENIAKSDAKQAGDLLNSLDNSEAMELGIKEVLDSYYSAEIVNKELVEDFTDTLDVDVEDKIVDYQEARDERDNAENLDYAVGEAIVTFDKETTEEEIDQLVSSISDSYEVILDNDFEIDYSLSQRKKERLKSLESYQGNIVVKVNLDLDQTVARAQEEFQQFACVTDASANTECEIESLDENVNDPYADEQWYLDRCNFEDAWDSQATAGCYDIWIAVLDTGCRITHNDLKKSLIDKYSVDVTQKDNEGKYKKLSDLKTSYSSEHGTICTGVVAARVNNSKGVVGASRGWEDETCRVMSIKVSDNNDTLYTSNICAGIVQAVNSGAEVISISICGSTLGAYRDAIDYAEAAGVIIVAAAGNNNSSTMTYPAADDYVIAVGGTNQSSGNSKASFSNYGDWVDIVAPATGYVTTGTASDDSYVRGVNGTSLSTPLVASAIGLMLAVNPSLSVKAVKKYLCKDTVTEIDSKYFSCGLLNAGLAVQKAKYVEFKNSTITLTSVTALSNKRIKIKWNDLNVYGPEKTCIYRSTSKTGEYTRIKTILQDDTSCYYIDNDSDLVAGKTYYYKVRVAMKYGTGYKYTPYSDILSVKAQK